MSRIRPARSEDCEAIFRLRRELREWLAARGSDQWSVPVPGWADRVRADVEAGNTWVVDDDAGVVVATITVNGSTDPGLWTPDEVHDARFVHRAMVARSLAGRGIGVMLLDRADAEAAHQGAGWLRLDAWTTSPGLHAYYRRHGFRHVRTVHDAATPSAALFERPTLNDPLGPGSATLGRCHAPSL